MPSKREAGESNKNAVGQTLYDDDGVSGNLLLACRRRRWPYISGGGGGTVLVAETEHSKRGGWDGAFPLTLKITVQAKKRAVVSTG